MGSGRGKTRRTQAAAAAVESKNEIGILYGIQAVRPHVFAVINIRTKEVIEYFGAKDYEGDDGARKAARATAIKMNEAHIEKATRQKEFQDALGQVSQVDF